MNTALTALLWLAVAWTTLGLASALYALYRFWKG